MIPKPMDLIPLQNCHMTQHTRGNVVTEWSVEENITNDKLFGLPRHLSEKEVFAFIDIARKYELEALNAGINFQKNKHNDYLYAQIKELKDINQELIADNERLATVLDKQQRG